MILGKEDLSRKRFGVGVWGADGKNTAAVASTLPFRGSVQPVPGNLLETLSEAERQRGAQVIYTKTSLKTLDQLTQIPADIVTRVVDGSQWEVRTAQPWPKLLSHFEVVVVRLKEVG